MYCHKALLNSQILASMKQKRHTKIMYSFTICNNMYNLYLIINPIHGINPKLYNAYIKTVFFLMVSNIC